MLTDVPLTLSGLRAACGEPSMAVEACAICSQIPATLERHEALEELVPFIAERHGNAVGSFHGDGPVHLAGYVYSSEARRCPTCRRIYLLEYTREYMESRSPYELVDPPEDTYTYRRLDPEQLLRTDWFTALRLERAGFEGELWGVAQPYFRRHSFGRVRHADATRTIVLPDEGSPIVADLPAMARVIASDPPDLHGREVDYARFVDISTSEYPLQFTHVDTFDGIPWRAELTEEERAQIEDLRSASRVEPMRVDHTHGAVVIQRRIVAHRRLICRVLTVRPTGEVTREDAIVGEDIPVRLERRWDYDARR